MIRTVGTRIILPKGDTGSITLTNNFQYSSSDDYAVAVFSVFDEMKKKTLIEKVVDASEENIVVEFESSDTKSLDPGTYFWDVKIYTNPIYDEDDNLIDGDSINSIFAAYKLPYFIIKEVGKNYE